VICLDSLEVVLESLATGLLEGAVEECELLDAVEAEGTEVVAELAPGDEGPGAAPAVEGEGADGAPGGFAVEAGVSEGEDAMSEASSLLSALR
jgi:hypothetical protein